METGLPPIPTHAATQDIPSEIYEPLLNIARGGYDANDVRHWYLTMLRHLRRIGVENAEAAYHLATPVSDTSPALMDTKAGFLNHEHDTSLHPPTALYSDEVSPKTDPYMWSKSPSYEPPFEAENHEVLPTVSQQPYDPSNESPFETRLQAPFPEPPQQIFNPVSGQAYQMPSQMPYFMPPRQVSESYNIPQQSALRSANWVPSRSAQGDIDARDFSAATNERLPFSSEARPPNQWFSPNDFGVVNNAPPNHYMLNSAPYQVAMSNTEMPVLVPYDHGPPANYTSNIVNSLSNVMGMSSLPAELYCSPYLPTIPVIPSRKRRKMLQKGVKKIMQPLQQKRQSV